jgi:hypothetical protein
MYSKNRDSLINLESPFFAGNEIRFDQIDGIDFLQTKQFKRCQKKKTNIDSSSKSCPSHHRCIVFLSLLARLNNNVLDKLTLLINHLSLILK